MKNIRELLTSSGNDCWRTPLPLFESLDEAFHFDFDACATVTNTLCGEWSIDILCDIRDGNVTHKSIFCNPPYSQPTQSAIVQGLIAHSRTTSAGLVLLIPARVETVMWQDVIFKTADYVHLLRGRVNFDTHEGKKASSATFPSALVIMNHSEETVIKMQEKVCGKLIKRENI